MGRRLALLIATYEYQDRGLQRLAAPARDAESLAAVLRNPDVAGFEVTTLLNKPKDQVHRAIEDFCREGRSDDLVVIYFTGHGLRNDAGQLFLAMADTDRSRLRSKALSAEDLDAEITGCTSRQKVLTSTAATAAPTRPEKQLKQTRRSTFRTVSKAAAWSC